MADTTFGGTEPYGFIIYADSYLWDDLTDEQMGRILRGLIAFKLTGEIVIDRAEYVYTGFKALLRAMEVQAEKYVERCKQAKAAAETRWNKEKAKQDANASGRIRAHIDACGRIYTDAKDANPISIPMPFPNKYPDGFVCSCGGNHAIESNGAVLCEKCGQYAQCPNCGGQLYLFGDVIACSVCGEKAIDVIREKDTNESDEGN